MANTFSQWKRQCLSKIDLSKKGSVDVDIAHVVSLINGCQNYFTTSSCSGRIILIDGVPESTEVQKQNCVWLFVSHQKCEVENLVSGLSSATGDTVLKFEPFILHVQCRRLEDAQLMHSVAVSAGLRNSGLTVSKAGKIITAVRSTHSLEVPLSHHGRLLVGQDYVHFLVQVANQKMEENLRRIHRFFQSLQSALSPDQPPPHSPGKHRLQIQKTSPAQAPGRQEEGREDGREEREKGVYRRRRRRRGEPDSPHRHDDTASVRPDLEDCLDLFTESIGH